MKPKVGVFSFTGCEGCQLAILSCEEQLPALLNAVDLVVFREAMDPVSDDYDIAIVEGSITTPKEIEEVQEVRQKAKILVAIGACACMGGVNGMKNLHDLEEVRRLVYGDKSEVFDTLPVCPVDAIVPVDFRIPGCPPDGREFLEVITALLAGRTPKLPAYSVCVECKFHENVCLFHTGGICLGPITRAGCGAICPTFGASCSGCRGLVDDPNLQAHHRVLEEAGLTADQVLHEYQRYMGCRLEGSNVGA